MVMDGARRKGEQGTYLKYALEKNHQQAYQNSLIRIKILKCQT